MSGDERRTMFEARQTGRSGGPVMSADFSKLMAALAEGLEAHADRDGLTGVRRAVFLARGGHGPGTACPSEPPPDPRDRHVAWCEWPDETCICGADHDRG